MEHDQFDRLSRLVAAGGTRRGALRLLVASVVAGLAGATNLSHARTRHRRDRQQGRARAEQAKFCTNLCVDCAAKPIRPGADLARCDFDGESFADGLNLSSARLAKACFARAELRGARFNGANASGACFADAELTGASFRGATLRRAVFCGADLNGVDFRGSNVTEAQLACATVGCDTILPNGQRAVNCGPGGSPTNLCCEYVCPSGPAKFVCIENAVPGETQCDDSSEGCSFNDANFVATCSACGG